MLGFDALGLLGLGLSVDVVNTNIVPLQGNLVLSPTAETVAWTDHRNLVLQQGNLALSPTAPTVIFVEANPSQGNLILSTKAPTVKIAVVRVPFASQIFSQNADIRLRQYITLEGPSFDWFIRDTGTLDDREELATAVRLALGTDSLSDINDILPDPDSTDRRGWWGDMDAEEIWGGWPIGCKSWLLSRAKITDAPSQEGSTLERARRYTINALQPFIDKRISSQIDVTATRTELDRIVVQVLMYRGPELEIDLRYQTLWEEDAVDDNVDDNASLIVAPTNVMRRIPFISINLSSSVPTVAVTTTGGFLIPLQGNLALSPTPPTRSP